MTQAPLRGKTIFIKIPRCYFPLSFTVVPWFIYSTVEFSRNSSMTPYQKGLDAETTAEDRLSLIEWDIVLWHCKTLPFFSKNSFVLENILAFPKVWLILICNRFVIALLNELGNKYFKIWLPLTWQSVDITHIDNGPGGGSVNEFFGRVWRIPVPPKFEKYTAVKYRAVCNKALLACGWNLEVF